MTGDETENAIVSSYLVAMGVVKLAADDMEPEQYAQMQGKVSRLLREIAAGEFTLLSTAAELRERFTGLDDSELHEVHREEVTRQRECAEIILRRLPRP